MLAGCAPATEIEPVVTAQQKAALDSISAANLKGDLSFIASDVLQGRYTPSPGLEVAAEFIASQFRAARLKPAGDHDYFQTAPMIDRYMPKPASGMTVEGAGKKFTIAADSLVIFDTSQAVKIDRAPVLVFPTRDLDTLKKTDIAGKAIVVEQPDFDGMSPGQAMATYRKMRSFDIYVGASKAAIEIVVTKRLAPASPRLLSAEAAGARKVPVVQAANAELQRCLKHPDEGSASTVSTDVPGPENRAVTVKNVIGILPGSDPKLKDTYVLLTAHYDHIGTTETAGRMAMAPKSPNPDDHIYNGANDDGSGTVSVIEIARALAKLNQHPKRTLVFMTFFGEERGELGSRYYGEHPIFPISKTVADVNLEQVGRTDEVTNGKVTRETNTASLTGFDYSDVPKTLAEAGKAVGIRVYTDPEASDAYFTRSDNDALAEQGIPAHTLTVAFDYPDYHALGDEWQKVDYENMARVDRMVALALIRLANNSRPPQWNAQNPKTAPFREAQRKWAGQ
ncbi:MAG: M20/M25/M40 family metallo-hydrolase [Acidobacteriaceae bacterium]|nr:M20/M25/M40 family metallo-hydrolase [Acidobacteriaceae bacterium]